MLALLHLMVKSDLGLDESESRVTGTLPLVAMIFQGDFRWLQCNLNTNLPEFCSLLIGIDLE